MRFMIADTFQKSLLGLDSQDQNLVKQVAFDFQLNPAMPSARFHRLDKCRDKRFWSARVNRDIRIIIFKDTDILMLLYTNHHDKAYQWAENRQLEPNPQTGAMQLVEIHERVEEVVKRIVHKVEQVPLFAHYERDYLQALGVPERWLDMVCHVDESGFLELIDHLPQEAAENLMKLAQGQPVPRPVTMPDSDPFMHPDAQRRFRTIDGDQALLRRALESPWEQWAVFLHPTQREAATKRYNGPAKVTGGAGTGKTVVALHRASELAKRNPDARILLTTFSKTLSTRLEHHLKVLLGDNTSERNSIQVEHLHRLARRLWEEKTGKSFTPLTDGELTGKLERLARTQNLSEFSVAFLRTEWEDVIEAQGISTWDDYKQARRGGRGVPLGVRQRLHLWHLFAALQDDLREAGLMTFDRLCHEVRHLLEADDVAPFDHVIADEVQDFSTPELQLLRALVAPGPDDLFLTGDIGQRIYKAGSSFAANGIEVRGRSTILRLNYRTTEQIRRYADALLPGILIDDDGEEEGRATISLLTGPIPQVIHFTDQNDEVRYLAERVEYWLKNGFSPGDIALFARTNYALRDRAQAALELCGLASYSLNDQEPFERDRISLGTMHRAKGLEFRIVVLVGCDADQLPLAATLRGLSDETARTQFCDRERNLFYVACTRAREQLIITHVGVPSPFLNDKKA